MTETWVWSLFYFKPQFECDHHIDQHKLGPYHNKDWWWPVNIKKKGGNGNFKDLKEWRKVLFFSFWGDRRGEDSLRRGGWGREQGKEIEKASRESRDGSVDHEFHLLHLHSDLTDRWTLSWNQTDKHQGEFLNPKPKSASIQYHDRQDRGQGRD